MDGADFGSAQDFVQKIQGRCNWEQTPNRKSAPPLLKLK